MAAFSQARDTLQERGYKTVVDGLSPLSLQFFDPGLLKSDFIKINWDPQYEVEVDPVQMEEVKNVIDSNGKEGMILARVNTNKAIKWGMELGITKFQGFFIDALMEKVGGDKKVQPNEAKNKRVEKVKKEIEQPSGKVKKAQPATPVKSISASAESTPKA